VPCSASRIVPGAHRVVGPGTHRGSGPREVHTTKCYCCGSTEHFAAKCPDRKDKKDGKSANMVISETGGTSGYGNPLPTVLSVCHSPDWWIDTGANIHVCADISLFSSYQAGGISSLLMGN
jgi:hypothetical protein